MSDTTQDVAVEQEASSASEVETKVEGQGEQTEEQAKPFRAWEHKVKREPPDQIPYTRFREVNEERKAAVARAEQYEAKIAELERRQQELDNIKDPDEINIDDYDDPKEYLKARDKATKAAAVREIEERFLAREQERLKQERLSRLDQEYQANVAESIKRNPEIKEAVAFLDEYAQYINPQVAYEIMQDRYAGEIIHAIATDQKLLTQLFRGNPQDTIRQLHKLSARYDLAESMPERDSTETVVDPREAIKLAIPKQLRSVPTSKGKDISKMSSAEYRAFRERNRK